MPEVIVPLVIVTSVTILTMIVRSARRNGRGITLCYRPMRRVDEAERDFQDRLRLDGILREATIRFAFASVDYLHSLEILYKERGQQLAATNSRVDRTQLIADRIVLAREIARLNSNGLESVIIH